MASILDKWRSVSKDSSWATDFQKHLDALERDLGLPNEFFDSLLEEDDWSFIIKIHALVESAVTYMLAHQPGLRALGDVLGRLDLNDPKKGKVAVAKALNLLDPGDRSFIRALAELRNDLVHNISSVNFDLGHYVHSRDSQQKKSFAFSFSVGLDKKQLETDDLKYNTIKFIIANPKFSIWLSTMCFLSLIYLKKELGRSEIKLAEVQSAAIEAIDGRSN